MKLIHALASGLPESEFNEEDYHTNWNAVPFSEDGPIDDAPDNHTVDIREGLEVVLVFDYHSVQQKDDGRLTENDSDDTDDEPFEDLHIVGSFLLQYTIQEPDDQPKLVDTPIEMSAADVKAFADFNSTFNAWPYWREFVQSMTARMGLPSVIIPVLPVPNLIARPRGGGT